MRSVSKKNARLVTWMTVVVTLLPFVQYFASGITAVADSTDAAEETLFDGDTGSGKVSYQKDPDGKQIDWKISYQKTASDLARQIGFSLKTGDQTIKATEIASQPSDLFSLSGEKTTTVPTDTILQSQANKDAQQAEVTFKTPLVEHVTIQTIMNEWQSDGSQTDLLHDKKPVEITVPKAERQASSTETTSIIASSSNISTSSIEEKSTEAASTHETSTTASVKESSKSSSLTSTSLVEKQSATTTSTTEAKQKMVAKAAAVETELLQEAATGKDITKLTGSDQLKDSKEGKTIFDTADIYVNGSKTPMKDGDQLNLNDSLLLKYTWALPEVLRQNMKAGDFINFKLPTGFKVQGDKDLTGDLNNDQGTTFGNFVIHTDSSVTITFTDAVTTNSGIHGTFNVGGQVNQVEINTPGHNPIVIPFTDNDKTIVPDVVVPNSKSLDKSVAAQTDNNGIKNNQGSVTWKMTVNKTGTTMADGVLEDTLPVGATFDASSVKVEASDVDLATGNLTGTPQDVTSTVKVNQTGRTVKFSFPDSKQAYVVTYTTKVDLNKSLATDGKSAAVENNAKLSSKGTDDVTAKATATFGSASDIHKTAGNYDATNHVAAWTVKFTKSGLDVPKEAFFTDTMDNGQSFTDQSGKALSLTDLEKELNNQLTATGNAGKKVVVTKNNNGSYKMSFPAGISDSFIFTYYTKVEGKNGLTYNNGIKWNDKGNTVNQGFIKQSGVTKGFIDTNHDGKPDTKGVVTWQVGINAENAPLDKWTVTDKMTNTAIKDASDVKVYEVKKGAADSTRTEVPTGDYKVEPTADGTSFTVTYNKATNSKFIIEYTSKYSDDIVKNTRVTNHATYTYWENGNHWKKESNSSFVPNPDTQKKLAGNKGGSYNFTTNAVTWTINANTGKIPFGDNAILTDPIPADQTYDQAKAEVKTLNVDGSKATELKTTYVAKETKQTIAGHEINGGTNGVFVVTGFPKDSKNQYQIQFTTKMAATTKLPTGTGKNTATLADDANKPVNISGQVSYTKANGFISKASKRNGDQINYTVTVNPNSYPIYNVVVTDNNWKNVKVDPSSVVVKNKDGEVDKSKYSIDSEEQQFKLKLGNIDTTYTIQYTGTILYNGDPNEKINVSNDVQINGDNIQEDGQHTSKQDEIVVPSAGGDAQGETRSLTITKQDVQGNALKGAEFTLYRGNPQAGKVVISNVATNEKGQVKFDNLTFDTYYLVETKAPNGYYVSGQAKTGIPYVIDKDTATKGYLDPATQKEPVLVNKPTGKITLTKADQNNKDKKLANAVFELEQNGQKVTQDASGNPIDTFATDSKGQLTIDNVVPGNYQLKEVKAPTDYTISATTTDVTVESGKTATPTVTNAVNTKEITGTKTWNDNNDQDGERPDSIIVDLMNGDKKVATKTVTEKDNWKYTFKDLPVSENGKEINYTVKEEPVAGYETTVDGPNITNTHKPETTVVQGSKTWTDGNDQDGKRPAKITVQLKANDKVIQEKEVSAETNWQYEFTNLPVKENGNKIAYTVAEKDVPAGYQVKTDGYNLTNTYTPATTEFSGQKIWNDKENQDGLRPTNVKVQLMKQVEGQATPIAVEGKTAEATKANGWNYSFTGLPVNENGKKITYSVQEVNVPTGYQATVDGQNVVNTHQPATTKVSVKKTWEDKENQDGKRPSSVTVQLYADGKKVGDPITLNADNQWTHQWDNLAKNAKGQLIKYTVEEKKVEGYTSAVTNDGNTFTITNTHQPEVTQVSGMKHWEDNDNQDGKRPTQITVHLLKNGTTDQTKTVTAADGWKYSFTSLPKYDNGQLIKYSVSEDNVPNYKTTIDGTTITNSYTPERTSITGTKSWEDKGNQDGKRPAEITIHLLADGQQVQEQIVKPDANGNWTYSFDDLPIYNKGQKIKYTVTEDAVLEYKTEIEGSNIKNIHQPETTQVSVKKTWEDKENQDGKRPKSVTVQLMADGEALGKPITLDASNDWSYNWKDLAKFENKEANKNAAKPVSYTVAETPVADGYTAEVTTAPTSKTPGTNYVITNRHTPQTTTVKGEKVWEDSENQDGLRPASIEVQLYANGEAVKDQVQTVKADTNGAWTYEFNGLPMYKDGKKIVYTTKEVNVPAGYTEKTEGNTITNTHKPEVVTIDGTKTWNDNENQDGKRPENITVTLLADGQQVAKQKVTSSDGWTYEFKNLPKFKDGKEIYYTVLENKVAGYTPSYDGSNITNTHQTAETTYTVKKAWDDADNQDGVRPTTVKAQLYADGQKYGKAVTLANKENWTYTWKHLAKLSNKDANGHLTAKSHQVVYTVKEVNVDKDYEATVAADEATNTAMLTNKHIPAKTTYRVKKVWNDADNQDGVRPTKVKVQLYANGKAQGTPVTLNAKKDWAYTWKDLAKFNQTKLVNYSVREIDVDKNYAAEIQVIGDKNSTTIKNTHTPAVVNLTGTKVWNDAKNQDGLRPGEVKVRLYENGKATKQVAKANKKSNWSYTFKDLPKFAKGKEITYSVKEVKAVKGYKETDDGMTITNTHKPETTTLNGEKTWADNDDQDGKRPAKITVHLMNGDQEVAKQVVDARSNWKYEFKNVPVYAKGQKIAYTVKEDQVADYTTKATGLNLTNTHKPEMTTVTGTKTWSDQADQYKTRPDKITVRLLAGKKVVKETAATAANNWTYEFKDLPKYDHGKEIHYSVSEARVPGYKLTTNGFDLQNTLETTRYTGTKIWEDQENKDNLRPTQITVELMQNGEKFGEQVISADTKWTYAFENLPKVDKNDNLYVYSVKEKDVPTGYKSMVVGKNIVNVHVPNVPNVPNKPNKPNIPDVPNISNIPNIPGIPDIPGLPDTPGTPEVPSVPDNGQDSKTSTSNTPTTVTMPSLRSRGTLPNTGSTGSAGTTSGNDAADTDTDSDATPSASSNRRLPKTNDQRNNYLIVVGLIIIAAVIYFWRKNRKHA